MRHLCVAQSGEGGVLISEGKMISPKVAAARTAKRVEPAASFKSGVGVGGGAPT